MKKIAPNKFALGVALSAALATSSLKNAPAFCADADRNFASLARPAATQGETATSPLPIKTTQPNANDSVNLTPNVPQETGADPFFSFPETFPPNAFDFAPGSCPSGTCPVAPNSPENRRVALRPTTETPLAANPAIRSVARVYNEYRETLPATGTGVGTINRDVVEKGSGAFVADANGAKYVLTAAHIFRDGRGAITVESVDGRDFPATLVLASEEYDVALLRLETGAAQDVPALVVSSSWPKQGDVVWRAGFGPNETLKSDFGAVKGYVKTSRYNAYETLKIAGVARQGDSGGPICNRSGEIVGVLWGTDGSNVYATYSVRILKTLCDYSAAFVPPELRSEFAAQNESAASPAAEHPAAPRVEPPPATPDNKRLALDKTRPQTLPPAESRPTRQDRIVATRTVAAARRPIDAARNFAREYDRFFWNSVLALLFLLTFSRLAATINESRNGLNGAVPQNANSFNDVA